jgi:hypothetical protein
MGASPGAAVRHRSRTAIPQIVNFFFPSFDGVCLSLCVLPRFFFEKSEIGQSCRFFVVFVQVLRRDGLAEDPESPKMKTESVSDPGKQKNLGSKIIKKRSKMSKNTQNIRHSTKNTHSKIVQKRAFKTHATKQNVQSNT